MGPAAHNERRDGWCRGVHFLSTLTIYSFNYPGAFNKRLSLKLSVLTTKIPVTCVGVLSNFWPCPPVFPRALARFHGWDAWLPWQELPSADSPTMAPPGTTTASEPTSSLNWGVPFPATPPQRPRGRPASQAPFRGSPVPSHCPRGLWRPGPRISGSPVPTTLSRPPMGPWPTTAD